MSTPPPDPGIREKDCYPRPPEELEQLEEEQTLEALPEAMRQEILASFAKMRDDLGPEAHELAAASRRRVIDQSFAHHERVRNLERKLRQLEREFDRTRSELEDLEEADPCGGAGWVACWSPGGPCPSDRYACGLCGPCRFCDPSAPAVLITSRSAELLDNPAGHTQLPAS